MPKLFIQLKKSPPLQRWKSLEVPSSPTTSTQPSAAIDLPPSPRMGSSIQKEGTALGTPLSISPPDRTTRPVSSTPQNVTKPVEKQKSLSLVGGAGNASAAVKIGTVVKLAETSYTGLINIGNTCYMNSIVQSLSNTHELRDYLISELTVFDGIDLLSLCTYCDNVSTSHVYTQAHTRMDAHAYTQHMYTCTYVCVQGTTFFVNKPSHAL